MGSHVVNILLSRGYSLRIFVKKNINIANIGHLIDDIEFTKGDFTNKFDVNKVINDVDYIIHIANSALPLTSHNNPIRDIDAKINKTIY